MNISYFIKKNYHYYYYYYMFGRTYFLMGCF